VKLEGRSRSSPNDREAILDLYCYGIDMGGVIRRAGGGQLRDGSGE